MYIGLDVFVENYEQKTGPKIFSKLPRIRELRRQDHFEYKKPSLPRRENLLV